MTDALNAYAVTATIKRAVLEAVIDQQAPGTHFTGAAGDAVLSASSLYLADLIRGRNRRRTWSHAQAHARLRNTTMRDVLARNWPAACTTL
ncbi:hypothetical protein [Streptomyces blastmyceticus]|uniref:hypothetical protein n=1 Tax=Streptomyces blastmyceticus TaxID=68180 RepID=UPI0031E4145F